MLVWKSHGPLCAHKHINIPPEKNTSLGPCPSIWNINNPGGARSQEFLYMRQPCVNDTRSVGIVSWQYMSNTKHLKTPLFFRFREHVEMATGPGVEDEIGEGLHIREARAALHGLGGGWVYGMGPTFGGLLQIRRWVESTPHL